MVNTNVGALTREVLYTTAPPAARVGAVVRETLYAPRAPAVRITAAVREVLRSQQVVAPTNIRIATTEASDTASFAAGIKTSLALGAAEAEDVAAFVARQPDLGTSAIRPAFAEWLQATMDLWPPGIAWSRDPVSNLGKLTGVIAQERQSRHDRALELLEVESVPTSAAELLPEWEQALGLPDPCRAAPGTLAERWAAIADVFFGDHAPTVPNMVRWAAEAGWNITIREQRFFVPGISMAGDAVGESDFVWVVTVLGQQQTFFIADANFAGDPLWTFPDLSTLKCVIRRAAPAHTQVSFILP